MNTSRRQSTNHVLQFLGNIHVLNAFPARRDSGNILSKLFSVHLSQLAVISSWCAGNFFHLAWQSNYSSWIAQPTRALPIAHSIWDSNYSSFAYDVYSVGGSESSASICYSGLPQWMYTVGIRSEFDIYNLSLSLEIISVLLMSVALIHIKLEESSLTTYTSLRSLRELLLSATGYRMNYHVGFVIGLTSLLWSLHLMYVAIPISRGGAPEIPTTFMENFVSGNWIEFCSNPDSQYHIHFASPNSGSALLTFTGGVSSVAMSIPLSDIAHHHLALGVLCLWASHSFNSLFNSVGQKMRNSYRVYGSPGVSGVSQTVTRSLELELTTSLILVSLGSSFTAQHLYSLSPYVYLSVDYVTTVALFSHHIWIAAFCMLGSFVHATLFLIRDYRPQAYATYGDLLARVLAHKSSIVSHLSWVTLWLGFHTLLVFVHNDTVSAFGDPEKQISITPLYAQVIQTASGKSIYGFSSILNSYKGLETSLLPIGAPDLLAHHAIALGLHVTVLILIKGALDSRGSRLLPDKQSLGYGFPCDGPGRGGTCDVTAWDAMYLSTFWLLNTISWTLFYFHWKHLTLWQNNAAAFNEGGGALLAWFRDYLWFNSSPLIRGYSVASVNDLGVWAWTFLAAHLCWATGFMFLISWRGYWQELIESIIWAHSYTPLVSDLWNPSAVTPVALSIVQARFVGLVHFSAGLILTYAAFVIASTS